MKKYSSKSHTILLLAGLLLLFPPPEGVCCTLFGAIGERVEGGGVLIGKTRDRPQHLEQVFTEVFSPGGYAYRGISTEGRTAVTSGINERGLVVVSAAASDTERGLRRITTVGRILSSASSVGEVIKMAGKGEIQGPVHYLVGDLHRVALIEVLDGQRHGVLVKEDGFLCHTNHFILEGMRDHHPKIGVSSLTRLNRIEHLLRKDSLTKDDFIAFARDHDHGPGNNSICRHFKDGIRSTGRTVSAAVYLLPKKGSPEMWIVLGQPCQSVFERY
jgi:isopenicillin-N N-acyltransferase like protein